MKASITLAQYVKRRTGIALGGKGSLSAMLYNSLGASNFAQFWQYWNPIWSYYLSKYVMKPLHQVLPGGLAMLLTFAVSGALHDLAVAIIKWQIFFFFTPWFVIMGGIALIGQVLRLSYRQYSWMIRATCNSIFIVLSYYLTHLLLVF